MKRNRKLDLNTLAYQIVRQTTGEVPPKTEAPEDSNAVALGEKGGMIGGKARATQLSKKDLSAIGKMGARARWRTKP